MDQHKRTAGAAIAAALLYFAAFITLGLGLGMLFSYPDQIWFVGLLMVGCGVALILGARSNMKLSRDIAADSSEQLRKAAISSRQRREQDAGSSVKHQSQAITATGKEISSEIQVLANWSYTAHEWQQFIEREKKTRSRSATTEAILLLILGALLLKYWRNASWALSIAVSFGLAVVYWIGKYFLSMGSYGKDVQNDVIITTRSVIINGKVNTFIDGQYWLKNIELIDHPTIPVLQFVYAWSTRRGDTHEEIRIPVPNNKKEEALSMIERFRS